MFSKEDLQNTQQAISQFQLDGWLLYDFRRSNDLACRFLAIPDNQLLTRRFFYWIPRQGEPVKIVHGIEEKVLDHLPGRKLLYNSWQGLEERLADTLKICKRVAMEYSPRNAIPYVSKVDAGTIDVVRDFGITVVSSADLLQKCISVWDSYKLQTHLAAAKTLCSIVDKAWALIAQRVKQGKTITEYDVQEFILEEFTKENCITSDSPICAVNAHSANPHYCAEKKQAETIKKGDLILIDLWCKQDLPKAVYADITRMGIAAKAPTPRQQEIFDIVKQARDAATELVKQRFTQGLPLMGCEVDQCCRDHIIDAGYGPYFIHRTGHNIDETDHGNGANIDNLETQDSRMLLAGTCFSIEPGIYLPGEFGIRLEYDVYVHHNGQIQITGGIQEAITCLL